MAMTMINKHMSKLRMLQTAAILMALPLVSSGSEKEAAGQPQDPTGAATNRTLWDLIRADRTVSRFADYLSLSPDIVKGLSRPQDRVTVYAPLNEAFDCFFFPDDLPEFYWLYLAGYHMGPGVISAEMLHHTGTVSSFVDADIFSTYKQRVSTQYDGKTITFNHGPKYVSPGKLADRSTDNATTATTITTAVNGVLHHIDGVLELPNSTAHALRTRAELSTLRAGLAHAGFDVGLYNTNAHIAQTVFAPTDDAFARLLSPAAMTFLLSRGGRPYMRALLQTHVAPNQTLFSDLYWPHGGAAAVGLVQPEGSAEVQASLQKVRLPTLHAKLNLTAVIRRSPSQHDSHTPRWTIGVAVTPHSNGATVQYDNVPVVVAEETQVVVPDIVTMDGVVHLIDSLLLPPTPLIAQQRHEMGEQPQGGSALGKALHLLSMALGWSSSGLGVEDIMALLDPWIVEE